MFDKNNVDSGTKTTEIIREVQTVKTGETQVIKEEANPLIFVLVGVGITLVAVAVALATAYCVLKKRRQNEKIVATKQEATASTTNQCQTTNYFTFYSRRKTTG